MSFMVKKKRFKFLVKFEVEELSNVPFVNAMLFCKVRLLDGGNFTEFSTREDVNNHMVRWRAKYEFPCKMNANANTGILESCICRVSVRKELKGGKSYQKLGFADVNLAEFAGAGVSSRKYLLEGYDSKRRQDNSTLKVNIDTVLMSGDPLFKVPASKAAMLPVALVDELQPENKGGSEEVDPSGESVTSGSSGFGSLPRKPTKSSLVAEDDAVRELGHVRNSSSTSQQSKVSGYCSTGNAHSRQSSLGEATHAARHAEHVVSQQHKRLTTTNGDKGSNWSPSQSSKKSDYSSTTGSVNRQHRKLECTSSHERRVDSTRIDNDELVDELIKNTNLNLDDSSEPAGLQLYISKDGTPILGSQSSSSMVHGHMERVVMDR